jgi:hypothetical protein
MNSKNSENTTCPDLSKFPPRKTSREDKLFKTLQNTTKAC